VEEGDRGKEEGRRRKRSPWLSEVGVGKWHAVVKRGLLTKTTECRRMMKRNREMGEEDRELRY
jgi:hypothetical protein